VFRSDAELGIENIWVMDWNGCESMRARSYDRDNVLVKPEIQAALKVKDAEDDMLVKGIKETPIRKTNRLLREGRLGGQIFDYLYIIFVHLLDII
jgi:hypothetical protein